MVLRCSVIQGFSLTWVLMRKRAKSRFRKLFNPIKLVVCRVQDCSENRRGPGHWMLHVLQSFVNWKSVGSCLCCAAFIFLLVSSIPLVVLIVR
jgi:hypothetical protein